jgi:hypothetical protein
MSSAREPADNENKCAKQNALVMGIMMQHTRDMKDCFIHLIHISYAELGIYHPGSRLSVAVLVRAALSSAPVKSFLLATTLVGSCAGRPVNTDRRRETG